MSLAIGERAPDFRLPKQGGGEIALSDFAGKKNVVLFFYPKDDSPGCTAEACTFRDAYVDFQDAGAEVIGISADSVGSHEKFAHKHSLPFPLAADVDGRVRAAFGVKGSLLGMIPGRETFVIDKQGIVRHVFRSQVRPQKHVSETLEILKKL